MPIKDGIIVRKIRCIAAVHENAAAAVLFPCKGMVQVILIILPLNHRVIKPQCLAPDPGDNLPIDLL